MNDASPPAPSVEVPDGWVEMESTTEEVFSMSKVTVTATTVVYEDKRLRERVVADAGATVGTEADSETEAAVGTEAEADADSETETVADPGAGGAFHRFAFASRLRLRPTTKPSKPLTKLVTSRAKAGFADRLEARGMTGVEERETRRFRVDRTEATLVGYDAACPVGGRRLAVDGWVAVWPDDDGDGRGDYFVAGGAYPTRVLEGAGLGDVIEPGRFRDDLFAIVRSVR
jgi:hypothetical protein